MPGMWTVLGVARLLALATGVSWLLVDAVEVVALLDAVVVVVAVEVALAVLKLPI